MKLKSIIQKPLYVALVVFAVALLLGTGAAYVVKQGQSNSAVASSAVNCQDTCINLNGDSSDPEIITIKTGSYVQFNSADGDKYNIALEHAAVQHDDDSEFHSGDFGKDEAWRVQFKKDGTYVFRDEYHPDIRVTVIAYTEGKDYKVQ